MIGGRASMGVSKASSLPITYSWTSNTVQNKSLKRV